MNSLTRARRLLRVFLLVVLVCGAPPVRALDPDASLFDYRHDTWRIKDGVPNTISFLIHTADGWLWVGSYDGLYRFDGLTFERFVSPSGRKQRKNRISTMHAAENGDLLVAYSEGGFDIIRDGDLVDLPGGDKAPLEVVYDIVTDTDGVIWLATEKGLFRYDKGDWQLAGEEWGLPPTIAREMTIDRSRQFWVWIGDSWYLLDRAARRFHATTRSMGRGTFYAPDGQMWQVNGNLLERVPQGVAHAPVRWDQARRNANTLPDAMFDRDGNLWLMRWPNGVARIRKRDIPLSESFDPATLPIERLDQRWQLSSMATMGLTEDREGNIWVWTPSGIERFRHQRIRQIPAPDGVDVLVMYADARGHILAGAQNMDRLWAISPKGTPPPVVPETNRTATKGRDGAFVTDTATAIERRYTDHTERMPLPSCGKGRIYLNAMVEDRESTWAMVTPCGTSRYIGGKWRSASEYGVPDQIRYMTAGPDGAVWFAYQDGSVWRFSGEKLNKMSGAVVNSLRFIDAQAEILISGADGTAVWTGRAFQRLRSTDAKALNFVVGVMITADGDRWLHAVSGLVHVSAADWRASMADLRIPLKTRILDNLDGYPGSKASFVPDPNGVIDAEGRLWFSGSEGGGMLDPRKRYVNQVPPLLQLTGFRVDGAALAPATRMGSYAAASKLEIQFAAVSLTMPERLKVLYRLDGIDSDWQEAGAMRRAAYANLPPGSYRFRVKAANADGIWNAQEQTLAFDITPRFRQTVWFYLLCVAGVAVLGYVLYLLRMRQVVGRLNALLAARLMERERIARALHDSWLQSVHGLVLSFAGISRQLPESSAVRERMEELLTRADGVLVDGRNSVMGLRAAAVRSNDIEQAFVSLGERLQRDHGPVFALRIRGAMRPLDNVAWEEIYYVGYEALHNAYLHGKARRVRLTLDYGMDGFSLLVRDDGQGMPAEVARAGSREGHWGLVGMRERADLAGGELSLRSPGGRGTEVCLRIPAARAYVAGTSAGWLSRLRARLRWR